MLPTLQLTKEAPRVVYPSMAKALGVNAAIVIQQVEWWTNYNRAKGRVDEHGHAWTFNSYAQWAEEFPWLSERQVRRIINDFEERGILVSQRRSPTDATKCYRVDTAKLYQFCQDRLEAQDKRRFQTISGE